LLSKAIPYADGTISCFLSQLPTNKQLLSKSNPMLVVHPYAGTTDATDQSSVFSAPGTETCELWKLLKAFAK